MTRGGGSVGKLNTVPQSRHESVLVMLQEAQRQYGCVPEEVIKKVADSLHISAGEVYGIATFYSFLNTRPLGRNVVRVCQSLPCYLKHNQAVIDQLLAELGIKPGETTPDGKFSLEMTNCIGACDKAPAMLVNGNLHGDLTPEKIGRILQSYK